MAGVPPVMWPAPPVATEPTPDAPNATQATAFLGQFATSSALAANTAAQEFVQPVQANAQLATGRALA